MTRATIDSLKQALAVSPENLPLRMLLVRALFSKSKVRKVETYERE